MRLKAKRRVTRWRTSRLSSRRRKQSAYQLRRLCNLGNRFLVSCSKTAMRKAAWACDSSLTQGGGPWIAQQAFTNSTFITTLVPSNAPLSTFRVITMSRLGGLEKDRNGEDIVALSCVFRAGRANAETDHRCIMFDCPKGVLASGTTNAHWYCLGARKTLQCARWFSEGHEFDAHPDSGKKLKDASLGDRYAKMLALCTDAHRRLLSDVPLAGWDVALTGDLHESGEEKMILLEVNLSCNFFRGSFDQEKYFQLVNEYFIYLDGK
eukprot:GEMP01069943.1.p1 GENE.GEMP01069943.1~~GEMP01069943.1.p1  ORF type:complete len:265 (+),score=48.06 GEMP01069943.1:103-897(+)